MPHRGDRKGNRIDIADGVAYVHLAGGHISLADECDVEVIKRYTWYASEGRPGIYYARAHVDTVAGKTMSIKMHRLIMDPKGDFEVDHREVSQTLDNRRSNLRICTSSQNCSNRPSARSSRSVFKGVSQRGRKWRAEIESAGIRVIIGLFLTKELAGAAYNLAAEILHRDFAYKNSVSPGLLSEQEKDRIVTKIELAIAHRDEHQQEHAA